MAVNLSSALPSTALMFSSRSMTFPGTTQGHRKFLKSFEVLANTPGSFSRGVPFQFNPDNCGLRISGYVLIPGRLEKALEKQDNQIIQLRVRRINLLRNIQVSIGGVPLLYAGDEYAESSRMIIIFFPIRLKSRTADGCTDPEKGGKPAKT